MHRSIGRQVLLYRNELAVLNVDAQFGQCLLNHPAGSIRPHHTNGAVRNQNKKKGMRCFASHQSRLAPVVRPTTPETWETPSLKRYQWCGAEGAFPFKV